MNARRRLGVAVGVLAGSCVTASGVALAVMYRLDTQTGFSAAHAAWVLVGLTVVAVATTTIVLLRLSGPLVHDIEAVTVRERAVLETAVDGIITIDRRGLITSFNRAAEVLFGYARDEVIGANVSVLMPAPYRAEHDGYLERYLRTGEKRIIGVGREVTGRRRDGSTFPMELAVSEVVHKNERTFTGIVRDISERRAAEAASQRTVAALRNVHQIMARGESPFNKVRDLLAFGCCYFSLPVGLVARGAEADERIVVAHDPGHVLAGHLPQTVFCARLEAPIVVSGRTFGRVRFVDPARQAPLAASTEIDRGVLELIAQWIAADLDLQSEHQKLVRAEKLSSIGLLAAGVAHEVNNPLSGVMACVKAIEAGLPEDRRRQYFEAAHDGLARIQAIIKSLLDFARPRNVVMAACRLHPVVTDCLRLVAPVYNKKGIRVENTVGEDAMAVSDRSQLMQAFMNVFINAVHASPQGGAIVVSTPHDNEYVGISVRDHGPGIPKADIPRVCDPFFSTKAEGEGTGLGLAITLGLIEAHGGKLDIDSDEGRGTTVTLWLPRVSAAPDPNLTNP